MSRVSSLYQLQKLDSELDRIGRRLAEIEAILQDSALIDELQSRLEDAQKSLQDTQSKASSAEHAVQMQQDKLKSTEASLYGGAVTNPRELQDLQMEQESLKRHLATLEDRLLEAMVHAEDAEQRCQEAERDLREAMDAREGEHRDLAGERESLAAQAEKLQGEREPALEGIPGEDLKLYQELRERLRGMAVAELEADSCGACGLGLPASEVQSIRSGTSPVLCRQCGRILYGG